MPKINKVQLFAVVLLFSMLVLAATIGAARPDVSLKKYSGKDGVDQEIINCNGLDEDECLTRRSLAVHVDYIYTNSTPIAPQH